MKLLDIVLILVSSTGLLHGLSIAIYLMFFKKKRSITKTLLALILIFMAFRIGKSVLLHFGNDLEPLFVFIGLSFLLLIGPFLRWYVKGMTEHNFNLPKHYYLELAPFAIIVCMSLLVTKEWFDSEDRLVIAIFGSFLLFVYLHLATYIFLSARVIIRKKRQFKNQFQTKAQKSILSWLNHLIISFKIIWLSYFLNLIEDTVPYIVGPILYSIVIYYLSFKAYKLRITDLEGAAFKENEDASIFKDISRLVIKEKRFLESQLSLTSLSKLIRKSPPKTSEIINQYADQNFNDFINYHRIQAAKEMLIAEEMKHHTIAAIAFDSGFSSLSSFNSAFKKFEKNTPSSFRKEFGI